MGMGGKRGEGGVKWWVIVPSWFSISATSSLLTTPSLSRSRIWNPSRRFRTWDGCSWDMAFPCATMVFVSGAPRAVDAWLVGGGISLFVARAFGVQLVGGGVLMGGALTGGVSTGGVLTGGVLTSGVLTRGVLTGGVAVSSPDDVLSV